MMELELELEVSYNDKRCLVERAERQIGATDGTDGDRAAGCGVSVDRHSHARSLTRLLAASLQPSLAKPQPTWPRPLAKHSTWRSRWSKTRIRRVLLEAGVAAGRAHACGRWGGRRRPRRMQG